METLRLYNSNFCEDKDKCTLNYPSSVTFMEIVDNLNRQFNDGKIEILSLNPYNPRVNAECPVWYEIQSYKLYNKKKIVDGCRFCTSHYIGRFSIGENEIIIDPRYGNPVLKHLLEYATNVYLPEGSSDVSNQSKKSPFWLIAVLWKAMLNKALTTGQIPREYETITRNQKNFRGRLVVPKHIHYNLCDASRFYCAYRKLTMDNTINQTIRTVYSILKKKQLSSIVGEFDAYDKYLESMGVTASIDDEQIIENIKYTRLNISYQPVMNLSKAIISNSRLESGMVNGNKTNVSYFVDIAELWEMYLLKLLQNKLPKDYIAYSPNTGYGEYLLNGKMRAIRPDILIKKGERVVMVIDAKYKSYHRLGNTADQGNVQRDDLYQMVTYLYHYGNKQEPIAGVFTAPIQNDIEKDIYEVAQKPNNYIGLINLDISTIEQIRTNEEKYIKDIKDILKNLLTGN